MNFEQDKARFIREADAFLHAKGVLPGDRSLANTGHNDELDAFRHAYVSGRFAQTYGGLVAGLMGDYHEWKHPNEKPEQQMDLYNNAMGIRWAGQAKNPAALLDRVWQGVQDKELILAPGLKPKPSSDYGGLHLDEQDAIKFANLTPDGAAQLSTFLNAGRERPVPDVLLAAMLDPQTLPDWQRRFIESPEAQALAAQFAKCDPADLKPQWTCRPPEPDVPDFLKIRDVLVGTQRWDDRQMDNIAMAVLAAQRDDPVVARLDQVAVGRPTEDGRTNIFGLYSPNGALGPHHSVHVDAEVAARTPAETHVPKLEALAQQIQVQQADAALQQRAAPAMQA